MAHPMHASWRRVLQRLTRGGGVAHLNFRSRPKARRSISPPHVIASCHRQPCAVCQASKIDKNGRLFPLLKACPEMPRNSSLSLWRSCGLQKTLPSRDKQGGRAEGPGRAGRGPLSEPSARLSQGESEVNCTCNFRPRPNRLPGRCHRHRRHRP
jgi:hypothetical protein